MINATPTDTTDEVLEVLEPDQVDEIKQRSVRGAASYMVRTLLLQVVGLVSAGVLAAYLNAVDFAIYGIVTQIIGLLTFFSDVGLGSALIQKKAEPTEHEYRVVFTIQQMLSLGIFFVTLGLVSTHTLADKLGPAGEWVLLMLGLSFPLTTLKTIPSVKLERRLEFSKLVIPQMVEQILYQGILIVLVIQGFGVMSYAYAIAARTVVGVAVMWLIQPWTPGFSLDKAALRSMLGQGTKFQLNDFIARIKDNLFYLLLGLYLPNQIYGYITFAKTFSMLPYQLTVQNVIAVTFPTYARLQHHPELLRKAIEKTLFFISLLIFPMLVGMVVLVGPLTELVPRFAKWQPALMTFTWFTLSIGWSAVSTPLTNTLNAIGQISTTLKLMIMWTVLTWLLTPLLVWWFGYNGVSLAAFVIGITSLIPIYLVKKVVPVRVWAQVWRQLLAASVMGGLGLVGHNWWGQSWVHFVGGGALLGFTYLAVLGGVGYSTVRQEVIGLLKKTDRG